MHTLTQPLFSIRIAACLAALHHALAEALRRATRHSRDMRRSLPMRFAIGLAVLNAARPGVRAPGLPRRWRPSGRPKARRSGVFGTRARKLMQMLRTRAASPR